MSKQKGQGLVEFALILPLLLMMFFGIVEFGRIFQAYVTVQHAAREAARYAVTGRGGATPVARVRAIKETAVGATAGLNVDYSRIDWREDSPLDARSWKYMDEPNALLVRVWGPNGENDPGGPGERVMVEVKYNLQPLTPTFSYFLPRIAISSQSEMINEGFGPTVASLRGVLPPSLEPLPVMGPTNSTTLFTDAYGVKVTQYALGDYIYVTVTDLDEDFDLDVADTVTVTLTAPGDSETLTLTEQGFSTGVFRAGLPSIGEEGLFNGILNTVAEDTITAVYTDDDDPGDTSSDYATMKEVPQTPGTVVFSAPEYVIGDDIYVIVHDEDENVDPDARETVYVTVTDPLTEDSVTLELTETGPNTNEFRNEVGLVSTADSDFDDEKTLYTGSDHTITAEYTDDDAPPPGDISSATAKITAKECAVEIVEPVYESDTTVTVRGSPGDTIELWDPAAGGFMIESAPIVGSDCSASVDINVTGNLVDGHIIWAISKGRSDSTCVGVDTCGIGPPTATPTPTPTATPSAAYIVLDPDCISASQAVSITVYGSNWKGNKDFDIFWDTTQKATVGKATSWSCDISIQANEATTGIHTVEALDTQDQATKDVEIPCPPTPTLTPTATPLRPDLVITDLTAITSTVKAHQPVTFTASIKNQGQGDALSVFWVDLFVDPTPAPPEAGQSNGDEDWKAASFLGAGETATVILDYTFSVTGTHLAYGYVDTRKHIDETDEDNNAWGSLTLNVGAGTPPTATLASQPLCSDIDVSRTITVSGESWPTSEGAINIYWDGTSKGSVSPPQVSWSRPINVSALEALAGTYVISASTASTVITSTYHIPCSALGRIDGYTWIFVGGAVLPQGRVDVSCYDSSDNLIAETTSGENGYYDLGYLPAGTYTVEGQADIDGVLYKDTRAGVVVSAGSTERVTLLLMLPY
ncbi:MAG: TadE/TadG family type IV pilus assembly protein [Anaerolineae bacterium]